MALPDKHDQSQFGDTGNFQALAASPAVLCDVASPAVLCDAASPAVLCDHMEKAQLMVISERESPALGVTVYPAFGSFLGCFFHFFLFSLFSFFFLELLEGRVLMSQSSGPACPHSPAVFFGGGLPASSGPSLVVVSWVPVRPISWEAPPHSAYWPPSRKMPWAASQSMSHH